MVVQHSIMHRAQWCTMLVHVCILRCAMADENAMPHCAAREVHFRKAKNALFDALSYVTIKLESAKAARACLSYSFHCFSSLGSEYAH